MYLHSKQKIFFVGDSEGLLNIIDTRTSETISRSE